MDRDFDAQRISGTDARTRFAGVVLLAVTGYAHLLDLSHKVEEGIWYMAIAFVALIVLAIAISVALVRSIAAEVRGAWAAAALLSVGALAGYAVSRILPLPGMADHQGDWVSAYGLLAVIAETSLLALAAFAMRDLTVRGVPFRAPSWLRLAAPGLMPLATVALATIAVLPADATAHGGEDDEAAASGADGKAAGGSGGSTSSPDSAESGTASAGSHGDPFLGTGELGLALAACLGFVAWAGHSLHERSRAAQTYS